MNGDPEVLGAAADRLPRTAAGRALIRALRDDDNVIVPTSFVDSAIAWIAHIEREALDTTRDSRPVGEGLDERMLRWVAAQPVGFGDWACADCRPESDMLVAGFRCMVHEAKARLQAGPAAVRPATEDGPIDVSRDALTEWQNTATDYSEAIIALGGHAVARHQSPQQYDSESGMACIAPGCVASLRAAVRPVTVTSDFSDAERDLHWRAYKTAARIAYATQNGYTGEAADELAVLISLVEDKR